jgi:hypothetical protein
MAIGAGHDQCVFMVDALFAVSLMAARFDRAPSRRAVDGMGPFWAMPRCRLMSLIP